MLGYHLAGATLHVRYPTWCGPALIPGPPPAVSIDCAMDELTPIPVVFDRVFVCRSGAWTAPWLDTAFFQFLAAAPVNRRVNLDGVAPRSFDLVPAQELASHMMQLQAQRLVLQRHFPC